MHEECLRNLVLERCLEPTAPVAAKQMDDIIRELIWVAKLHGDVVVAVNELSDGPARPWKGMSNGIL